jgi:plasmid stabilization system protein ParE
MVAADEWWEANRSDAPGAVPEELRRAFWLIAILPGIGACARNVRLPDVRRVHLSRIHFFLYYRLRADRRAIEVLALWHTKGGSGPEL